MRDGPALDMVCGSRFLTKEHGYPAPISRRTGIHLFAFLLSRIIGQRVSDPTSGFRLYNRRGIALFARDYPHDYPEVEAVLMVHFHRLRMPEVPVRMLERGGGVSSIRSGKSAYYMIKVLLAVFIGLRAGARRARPGTAPRHLMETRIQILAIVASGMLLFVVLELVRRRAFLERYALLWLFSGLVLLALSVWKGALEDLAQLVGIAYPPNALFLVAFGFVLILLLHFSLAVSRLSDQTKVLAQRLALLEQRQGRSEEQLAARRGARAGARAGPPAGGGRAMTSVAVVGLGRVGLPLALSFAERGLDVIGVERVPAVLDQVGAGRMPFEETGTQELLERVVGQIETTRVPCRSPPGPTTSC